MYLLRARHPRLCIIPNISSRFLNARSAHTKANFSRITPHISRIVASGAVASLIGASVLLVGNVPDTTSNSTTEKTQVGDANANKPADRQPPPLTAMLRSYVVYTMCCIPALVDWSPKILGTLMSIPVVKDITEAFVRATFFAQFVGGDTAHDVVPLLEQLRAENKGVLLAYSVEVDESEASSGKATPVQQHHPPSQQPVHKEIVDKLIGSIDVAADFEDKYAHTHGTTSGRKTWVAIKLTALLPNAQSLINLSSYLTHSRPPLLSQIPFPGCARSTDLDALYSPQAKSRPTEKEKDTSIVLTSDDVAALCELHSDLVRICLKAKERNVKVVIDAEYSWYQPAIDAFTLSLQRQFNKLPSDGRSSATNDLNGVQPLVFGTYQAYLRRTPTHLAHSIQDAKANNYSLGVKLVRGAYHPHEIAAHPSSRPTTTSVSPLQLHSDCPSISPEPYPPVWSDKGDTDECYNACARLLLYEIKADIDRKVKTRGPPRIGVLFGTHNWESCGIILKELVDCGLAVQDQDEGEEAVRIGVDVTDRLIFGQLYGMSDALTNSLVDKTRSASPLVIKYVPYGPLKDAMPYLSRRAIENKSVLGDGGAADERKRAGAAIWKRIFG